MRPTCGSCRQRVSLSWRYVKLPWWCTGNSTQRGRRRWLCLRCWKMSARSMQCRVGCTHTWINTPSTSYQGLFWIVTTILSDAQQTAQSAVACCYLMAAIAVKYIIYSPLCISVFAAVMVKNITLLAGLQEVCNSLMLCSFLTNRWHCKQDSWPNFRPDAESIGEHGQQRV